MSPNFAGPVDVLLRGGHSLVGVEETKQNDRDRRQRRFRLARGGTTWVDEDLVVACVPRPAPEDDPRVRPTLDQLLEDAEWTRLERLADALRRAATSAEITGPPPGPLEGALARSALRELLDGEAEDAASLAALIDRLVVAREEEQRDA